MSNICYKISPDPNKNSISYSKNYRIFTTGEPVRTAIKFNKDNIFDEYLDIGDLDPLNIIRKIRYSTNRLDWSLWYDFSKSNLTELESLSFDESDIFFEIKYIYDNSTFDQLSTPLSINWIKLFLETSQQQGEDYTPAVQCSDEQCPMLISEELALFKPYEATPAIQIAHELSLKTNKIFGHDVIYFKTEPDRDGGDFIFKEWTLFKTTIRKCIKVLVPNNKFPDNVPQFTEFGVDFEMPFELHIDNIYFQQMFGRNAQPKKRDYLYFPLLNRMYEIQGSYLYRGFMMEPLYWKIKLTKFHPNIDMYMNSENRTFLDNLITTSNDLFGNEQAAQELDALDKQQTKTISTKYDETRQNLHYDLVVKILDATYNYSPLIEYYYDMNSVKPTLTEYTLNEFSNPNESKTQKISASEPYEIIAYESSDIFNAWQNRELSIADLNISSNYPIGEKIPIKTNGPKDSYSPFGKYVLIEGYKNLGFTTRKNIVSSGNSVLFLQEANAITYKKLANTTTLPNMTFCNLFNLNRGSQTITFLKGYDSFDESGIIIKGTVFDNSGGTPSIIIYITINDVTYTFNVGNINYAKWYALVIPISAQYGQIQVNLYSFIEDLANAKNFNGINSIYRETIKPGQFSFETNSPYCIPSANYLLSNIRLFNTMIQLEDHEFVISQLFVRDESTLAIIDNARYQLNAPFIAINR